MSADSYDVATALKDVDKALPEAGKLIRNYISILKSKAVTPQKTNENTDRERGNP